jgi:hypothetical protein
MLPKEELWHYQYYFKEKTINRTDFNFIIKEGITNSKCIIIKEGKPKLYEQVGAES